MSHIFHAIEKAVNLPTYNNDVQVRNYLVEQRGEGYDLELTFLREDPKTGFKKHFGTWNLESKILTVYISQHDFMLPFWSSLIDRTIKAIKDNDYPCKRFEIQN